MPYYVPIVVCSSLYGLIVSDIPLLLFSYSQGIAAASLDPKNPVFVTLLYGAMCGEMQTTTSILRVVIKETPAFMSSLSVHLLPIDYLSRQLRR